MFLAEEPRANPGTAPEAAAQTEVEIEADRQTARGSLAEQGLRTTADEMRERHARWAGHD
jgi:hypothetical protein